MPEAFAEFYDQAAREVYRYLVRALLGDRAAAEDLTQETFAAVVIAARTGRSEAPTMPWVVGPNVRATAGAINAYVQVG